jgi:pectate lyase
VSGLLATALPASGQQIKAFPQAEGFGAAALGGRGGDVYHVINLNNSGVGSLRYGIENAPSTGRTIVFDVGGWINLTTKLGVDTNIRNLTIAGQTAPGGIGVRGAQFSVGGDDVIVRHVRFRPGKSAGSDNDSINTNDNAERVIYDHVSAEFSTDGGFDNQATNVTLQFSSVSYGLQTHSTGALLENPHSLSLHHNLWAHNNTRNPKHRVWDTLDWVNNVIYNWDERAIYLQGTDDLNYQWTANVDGNYFIAGPNHGGTKPLSGDRTPDKNYETWWGINAYDRDQDSVHDGEDYSFGDRDFSVVASLDATRWRTTPFPVTDEVWKDASTQAAYERVLSEFGATPWARDEVDTVLRNSVVNRTGNIITRESDLVPLGVSNGGFGTLGGAPLPPDSDGDGMPDDWEMKYTPALVNVSSNNADFDNDGYTDLEEYLNDLAAFKATGPLEFSDAGSGRYANWQNWTRRWEPSRVDDVHINTGTATVDAVGQKAGTIRVGADVGTSGTLAVTGGWLEVTDDLVVGPGGTGTVSQTGGEVRVLGGGVDVVDGVYHLDGGTLTTPLLTKSPAGTFLFTGGVLHADQVAFDLVNAGGMLAPGQSIGETHVGGQLALDDGMLQIELASETLRDTLVVDGQLALGGILDVQLLGGFMPESGSWQIATAASIIGNFDSITDGFYVQKLGTSLMLSIGVAPLLAGDYNEDGVVDAADYTRWRDNLGAPAGTLPNDGDGGEIGQAQYDTWKANFGQAADAGSSAVAIEAVPEPASLLTFLIGALSLFIRRRDASCDNSLILRTTFRDHDPGPAAVRTSWAIAN